MSCDVELCQHERGIKSVDELEDAPRPALTPGTTYLRTKAPECPNEGVAIKNLETGHFGNVHFEYVSCCEPMQEAGRFLWLVNRLQCKEKMRVARQQPLA